MKNGKREVSVIKAVKKARREMAVLGGAYDGRFAPKVVLNKKKQASKRACRVFRSE